MKFRGYFFLFVVMLSMSGCQSSGDVEGLLPTLAPTSTATTLVVVSTTTPSPRPPTGTPTRLPPTFTLAPSQTSTSLPKKDILLYSPLAEHTIEQLFNIVSSPYAPPPPGDDARHQGVDFCYFQGEERAFIEGEAVTAVLSGKVAASQAKRPPYGNMVIIETTYEELPKEIILKLDIQPWESLYHLYAHFQEAPEIVLGERVTGGQTLGKVGKTGYNIVVAHLHFETRLGPSGVIFERMARYEINATEEELATYKRWRTSGTFRHFDPMELFKGEVE